MPLTYKQHIAFYVYAPMRENVNWLKGKKNNFLAWICPLLWPCSYCAGELIYYESDEITSIYFARAGSANYVLSQYQNRPYLKIVENS